jgi:DNA-binding NarL/FixJ family response regulator
MRNTLGGAIKEKDSPTSRELEVMQARSEGLSRSRTSRRLFISETTVKTHSLRLYTKLGVHTAEESIVILLKKGLIVGPTVDSVRLEALTRGEWALGRMVARGLTNGQIGARQRLPLPESTIKEYLDRIYTKLGVSSRAHFAAVVCKYAPPR